MPVALAISPHLDDAVFSAGGTLAQLALDDWRVIVATVFTASVPNPQGFALACQLDKGVAADVDYMALRRVEDARACSIIRAEPFWLPFAEAPHRGYRSAPALFGAIRDDDRIVDDVTRSLRDLIGLHSPDVIFAPQAIGAHVDHVAVHMAIRSLRGPMKLWTDFPYATRQCGRQSPFADEIAALEAESVGLTACGLKAKIEATLAYASQIPFQFAGVDRVDAFLATHASSEIFRRRRC